LSWLPFAVAFPLLPLFGAAALATWPRRWWSLFAVGAPAVLAVHLSDTIPDLEGDARSGVGGLAHRIGLEAARRLCLGSLAAAGLVAGAADLSRRDRPALLGSSVGLLLAALAGWRPGTQRVAVPAGAAAVGLGWVAALTREQ
jgi:4-hydroxybenzoate polyprenyltransferase